MKPRYIKHWNKTADNWRQTDQQKLLRSFSDLLNLSLFDGWLPSTKKAERLLKTDLFDESLTEGLCPLLFERANDVICIDLSISTVISAKNRYPLLHAVVADVQHLPFAPGTFDVIVSNSTLDHFKTSADVIASLKGLNLAMRNGAQLLVTLDNKTNPIIWLRNLLPYKLLHKLGFVPYYVGATFSAHRLKRVLRELNFSVLDTAAFWHFPRVIMAGIALIIHQFGSEKLGHGLFNIFLSFESLSKLPTRYITGQFVAARAIKRSG
ncbi:MAG: class I SAM-dependent methyltransferase [Deltaproteobacteria bacterium]|nr:class I SAM-dependent methyltransferase [Deltaproteobacteria bacterium]